MQASRCYRVVVPTMLFSLMLVLLPLPEWAHAFRPDWVTLFMIYWAMAMPEFVGLLMAWIFGLLLDVAQGTILGQHALGLVLVIWLVQMTYLRIRVASLIQQALVIFVLLLAKLLLTLWVSGLVGQAPENITLYLLPSVTGALIWPWLFIVLRDIRRRYTLTNRF
ncbi:MAG: rod shape-determining protein MreD [Gammaproteobacteria bacterium]|jgi:rod shape-determining protein MreD|nr:rod shape-determining protein MreD [Gammaproteobacteria bacterium]